MARTVNCAIDGLLTVGPATRDSLVLDPEMGWVHRNASGWHTTRGTPLSGDVADGFTPGTEHVDNPDADAPPDDLA